MGPKFYVPLSRVSLNVLWYDKVIQAEILVQFCIYISSIIPACKLSTNCNHSRMFVVYGLFGLIIVLVTL